MNQGMLMESLNLASTWNLPVLFVCKDDNWSITTQSERVTGGDLNERVRGLGVPVMEVDGWDVSKVWEASRLAIDRARSGQGPTFLHARCVHFEGHFLGFQLIRLVRNPLREMPEIAIPLTRSFLHPGGATFSERLAGLKIILAALLSTLRDPRRDSANDPVRRARKTLLSDQVRLQELEDQIEEEISQVLAFGLAEVPS
jgi:pyruvate dehydrogenase E1 component alpha subunit